MEATKSLDAILNRQDYKRLTEQLKERVSEIAKLIHKKMDELDVDTVYGEPFKVMVYSGNSNVGEYSYLAYYKNETYESLEEPGCHYYYGGDYMCYIKGVSNKRALQFLNSAKKIIEQLSEIEDQKAAEVSKALADTQDL